MRYFDNSNEQKVPFTRRPLAPGAWKSPMLNAFWVESDTSIRQRNQAGFAQQEHNATTVTWDKDSLTKTSRLTWQSTNQTKQSAEQSKTPTTGQTFVQLATTFAKLGARCPANSGAERNNVGCSSQLDELLKMMQVCSQSHSHRAV